MIDQTFGRAKGRNSIDVRVSIWCDKERAVIFVPMLFVFAGSDLAGREKRRRFFPGWNIWMKMSRAARRRISRGRRGRWVPYQHKITVPLMSVLSKSFYVGLMWKPSSSIAAVFDSPDRLFKSGGHVMGLSIPLQHRRFAKKTS